MNDVPETKVAAVVDSVRVLLNRGSKDNVELGMRFAILSTVTIDVPDPDEPTIVVARLPVARTLVKVVSVDDYSAIAETFRTLKSSGVQLPQIFGPYERADSILSEEVTAAEQVDRAERIVRRGDIAVPVPGNSAFSGILLPF